MLCHMKRPWIAAIIVATIFIVFRIITAQNSDLANFSPVAALVFCGAAFWKTNKWMLPTALVVWLISSPIANLIQGYPLHSSTLVTLLGFASVAAIGMLSVGKSAGKLVFGTLVGATSFYIITNTASFIGNPIYAKTLEGYLQCMWSGLPSYTPTYTFFRNSLIGNGLGTCLFLAIMNVPSIKKATNFNLIRQTA